MPFSPCVCLCGCDDFTVQKIMLQSWKKKEEESDNAQVNGFFINMDKQKKEMMEVLLGSRPQNLERASLAWGRK